MGKRVQSSVARHTNSTSSTRHTVIYEHPQARAPRFDSMESVMCKSHPPEPRRAGAVKGRRTRRA